MNMVRKNPIEDAHLLYIAFIIVVMITATVLIVEGVFTQGEASNLHTEETLSNLKVEILSSNNLEISLKITNKSFSTIKKSQIHFYWEKKEIQPLIHPESPLKKGEFWIVKIKEYKKGELRVFNNNKLIYSHQFP